MEFAQMSAAFIVILSRALQSSPYVQMMDGGLADGILCFQMHQLIELIKKEQNIYNIIFHEVIRQVSVGI